MLYAQHHRTLSSKSTRSYSKPACRLSRLSTDYTETATGALRSLDASDFSKAALEVEKAISAFDDLRHSARNALWGSTVLMLIACAFRLCARTGAYYTSLLASGVLISGVVAVLRTVAAFRRLYRPLLQQIAGHAH